MNNPRFKLYIDAQFISPYAMSAFVALTEKGLSFDTMAIDLATRQNQQQEYRGVSLTRRVPTLADGEFFLSESSAISEYLEELFPAPGHRAVYPAAPAQKAKAREIQAWLRSDLMPIRQERPTEVVFYQEGFAPLSDAAQAAVEKLVSACDGLLGNVRNGDNLFGEWCIADTDLALMINRLALHGDALPETMLRYAQLQWQRPSVQQWLQQAQSGRMSVS
ncbi:glutathione transferase [Herbaspirillum lusitanum]|uniref:Glutathione transferase n=1 Tax=Herbaspirillum lusitanum TaxID=213312 RepID=A0ABW9AA78_9BURK